MCEKNQTLPGAGPLPGNPVRAVLDERTLGYARERAADAQTCYDKAQAIHVPTTVRDLRQRRDELLYQRARTDEKIYTLNTILGVFEG